MYVWLLCDYQLVALLRDDHRGVSVILLILVLLSLILSDLPVSYVLGFLHIYQGFLLIYINPDVLQHYGFGLINLDLDGLNLFLQVSARVLHVPLQSAGMLTHRIDFGQLLPVKLARSI